MGARSSWSKGFALHWRWRHGCFAQGTTCQGFVVHLCLTSLLHCEWRAEDALSDGCHDSYVIKLPVIQVSVADLSCLHSSGSHHLTSGVDWDVLHMEEQVSNDCKFIPCIGVLLQKALHGRQWGWNKHWELSLKGWLPHTTFQSMHSGTIWACLEDPQKTLWRAGLCYLGRDLWVSTGGIGRRPWASIALQWSDAENRYNATCCCTGSYLDSSVNNSWKTESG